MHKRCAVVVVVLANICGCSSQSDEQTHSFMQYQENGLNISESTGDPKYRDSIFSFEKVCEIQEDKSNPASMLYRSSDGLVGPDGKIFIADDGNHRVAVFSPSGTYLTQFGQEGSGPGEFRSVTIQWVRNDSISVYDFMQKRTSLFTVEGTLLTTLSAYWGAGVVQRVDPLPNGNRLRIERRAERREENNQHVYYSAVVTSSKEDTIAYIKSPEFIWGRWFNSGRYTGRADIRFGVRSGLDFHPQRGILVWSSDEAVLNWYTLTGSLFRVMRLGFEKESVTRQDRRNHHNWWQERIQTQETEEQKEFYRDYEALEALPDFKSFWAYASIDDRGFIWLQEHDEYNPESQDRSSSKYRVLDPQGEYLGNVELPSQQGYIHNGHFLASETDQDSGQTIYTVYRMNTNVSEFEYQ
ncbi:6-bladed beta-propeller [Gemmatimonadota bacterium]